MKIALLFGGKSAEYEVSLMSAKSIYENIDKELHEVYLIGIDNQGEFHYFDGDIKSVADGSWVYNVSDAEVVFCSSQKKPGIYSDEINIVFDIVFPVLHGPFGEDGKLQGLLEISNLAYVGCPVLASAVAMDKDIAKKLFSFEGINQVPHITICSWDDMKQSMIDIEGKLGYPCFVKPANMGSSVGISKAKNRDGLKKALENAFLYDHKIVVEKGINAREIEVSILGNCDDIKVSCTGEIIPSDEFYDYDAKYKSNASKLIIPSDISIDDENQIKTMAQKAYKTINGEGLCRIDFFIDKDTNEIFLNEVNSMPGFTTISMYPKLWEKSGISYKELVERLICLAVERKEREDAKKSK